MTAPSTKKPFAIFLMGPTAAGKTDLAIELVQTGRCEIISVDSAQVYRGLDIGSAKPDAPTLAKAPHHLIDVCDPSGAYSAVKFQQDATLLMQAITERGKVPLLVGGTMLYFKTLVEPMADLPAGDANIREALRKRFTDQGLSDLTAELQQVDPVAFEKIDLQNPQRVQRALEVFHATGQPISEFWAHGQHDGKGRLAESALASFGWHVKQFAVMPSERTQLHERISLRFEQMLAQGFEQEVEALMARGDLHLDLPSMRSVGYRQMWQYLSGEISRKDMVDSGKAATRQLAKKQLTWLRGWPQLTTLVSGQTGHFDEVMSQCGDVFSSDESQIQSPI